MNAYESSEIDEESDEKSDEEDKVSLARDIYCLCLLLFCLVLSSRQTQVDREAIAKQSQDIDTKRYD
jgi:hypothetical protein